MRARAAPLPRAGIEEAKKRDHRLVGGQQELFFFHPLSPGVWAGAEDCHVPIRPSPGGTGVFVGAPPTPLLVCLLEAHPHLSLEPPPLVRAGRPPRGQAVLSVAVRAPGRAGSCFFMPHGSRIYNSLVSLIKEKYWEFEYEEVGRWAGSHRRRGSHTHTPHPPPLSTPAPSRLPSPRRP